MERVEALLAQGNYREAFEALTRALEGTSGPGRGRVALLLAEFYALYGPEEADNLAQALAEAVAADPSLATHPRTRALAELLRGFEGEQPALFRPGDPRAGYFLAQAALWAGEPARALELLKAAGGLPAFLAWRADQMRGHAERDLGRPGEAYAAYRRALSQAPPPDRPPLALDAAEAALEADRPEEALALLEEVGPDPEAPALEASWHYLRARAELALGNPTRALEALALAEQKEAEAGDPSYGVPLLKGQALMQTGAYAEAQAAFQEARRRAPPEEQSYVAHELGVAALEAGDLAEAERLLKEAFGDPDYPHRGAAAADLAELYYRLADLEATRSWAEEAIRLGQAASGELFLGHVAYDRMQLDEALAHYRRAAELAPEGSREWLVAEQTITEILAQQGYPEPEEVLRRAQAALRYTPPSDDWASALERYAERARALLSGGRTLN